MRRNCLYAAMAITCTLMVHGTALGQSLPGKPAKATVAVCPIIPLQLVTVEEPGTRGSAGAGKMPILTLDKSGGIVTPILGLGSLEPSQKLRLDPRGCLLGFGDVMVDQTARGTIWTLRQEMEAKVCGIQVGSRWLEIADDGTVTSPEERAGQGGGAPGMKFVGYTKEACCAAKMLLAAFLSMMPSMAVSDGNPVALDPPKDSACPESHKKK